MRSVTIGRAGKIIARGIWNYLLHKPVAISFEVTHSCNANCQHCDKGGKIADEELITPAELAALSRELSPLIAQISGGEPLLRDDIMDIARAFQSPSGLPFVVLVTNASLLTVEKYFQLKGAGVDQFSISLDFPDERHDANRGIPGLFDHLCRLLPQLSAFGNSDITLIVCVRRQNISELLTLTEMADRWNVSINFSPYTLLRTGNQDHFPSTVEDLRRFEDAVGDLIRFRREKGRIISSEAVLKRMLFFFKNQGLPHCRAGLRSLVVNPDGSLVPCAMKSTAYVSQREMVENFSKHNTCGKCFVSMRANTEKPPWELLYDAFVPYLWALRSSPH